MNAVAVERVSLGVAWLDGAEPDWREKVDVEQLDIGSARQCIGGQVFEGRGEHCGYCHLVTLLDMNERLGYGFEIGEEIGEGDLRRAWIAAIQGTPEVAS